MNEHSRPNPWPMQMLMTALVYLTLAFSVAVMAWMLVTFTRWAF